MVDQPLSQASLMGQTLGNYRVRALIGRGAMGTVYLADDIKLGRRVALKVLLGSLARNPRQVGRFQREAQAAAPLHHLNIVRIYEAGIRSGVPFIAMEFVEGEPLDRFLRRNGTVTWQQGLRIIEQVAEGLACAHEAGVVHRDVKPANILLDTTGRVRLTDFGIAHMRDRHTGFTEHDDFLGTPQFMSPEQCAGSGNVGAESDLFSLGVVLYGMLAGKLPFTGESTVAVVDSITSRTPERLTAIKPDVPDDVARLVAHLLEKDPRERPHSARALISIIQRIRAENGGVSALPRALDQFIKEQSEPRTVSPATPQEKAPPKKQPKKHARRRFYQPVSQDVTLAACVLVIAVLVGVGGWHWRASVDNAGPAPVLSATVQRAPGGHIQVPLPHRDWTISAIRWIGGESAVMLEVSGRPQSPAHGQRGVLAYDLVDDAMTSLVAPAKVSRVTWSPGLHRVAGAGQARYLAGSLLLMDEQDRAGKDYLACWSQSWEADRPGPKPVCVAPLDRGAFTQAGSGFAVPSPDGTRLALISADPETGHDVFSERAVRPGRAGVSVPRTDGRHTIVAGSVQYAPDGASLCYIREDGPGEGALWRLKSPGDDLNGTPLLTGDLDARYAWSPDSQSIVCVVRRAGAREVVLLDLARSRVTSQFGPGAVSPESWHPSGSYFLMQAVDPENEQPRIVAVRPDAPSEAIPLLAGNADAQHTAAISPDGRWAALATETATGTVLTLVDLSNIFLGASPRIQGV